MIGIIGKKLGMTQLFNEAGQQIPCTVIEAEPNSVLAVTSTSLLKSVQLGGLGSQRTARESAKGERTPRGRRATRAELGHAKKAGLDAAPRVIRSIRLDEKGNAKAEVPTYNVGDSVKVDIFTVGETVKVTGTTKGRGFQGVVKRWSLPAARTPTATRSIGGRVPSDRAPIRRASSRARRCRAITAPSGIRRSAFGSRRWTPSAI